MDRKGLILYNDMVSYVEYDKSEYRQLNNIDIPFVILDVKRTDESEEDIKTNLSRSSLQISGNVMKSIAKGVYQLELKRIMEVIENSQKEFEKDIYVLLKSIRNSSDMLKYGTDMLMNNDKLYFSKLNTWHHIKVWGQEEVAKEFLKNFSEPVLYHEGRIDKSYVSELIENGCLVCISENYLKTYMIDATSQHNGLRKRAVIKILHLLDDTKMNETCGIKEMWDYIKDNKEQLKEKLRKKMPKGILWLNEKYIRNDLEAGEEDFIVFESNYVDKYLDDDFCEILQNYINEKSLEHIIGIHKE